ncbi:MAG: hypothetical protein WBC09_05915 [Thermoanaerobaculia bacterium]
MRQIGGLVGGFFIGAFAAGLAAGALSVYVFEQFDPKFSGAPDIAFEVEFIGAVMIAFLGTLILALVAGIWRIFHSGRPFALKHSLVVGVCSGAVFVCLPWAVETALESRLTYESWLYSVVVWLYLLIYPLLVFTWALRRAGPDTA